MAAKQTNLCLSADVTTTSELLDVAEECGDSICLLKTHCDIISDFGQRTVKGLTEIAARKRFLIFEDRKFGDIGNTVQTQYAAGTHRIASWADLTNAHIFPGPAIITALKSAAESAISAASATVATEIYGGTGAQRKLPFRDKGKGIGVKESSDDDEDEDESDDDEEEEEEEEGSGDSDSSQQASAARSEPRPTSDRKPSVVSISTTISSSLEYASPPTGSAPQAPSSITNLERPPNARGLLLLAQMSSADNLFTPAYTTKCVELARQHRDFVTGFITQEALNRESGDNFICMAPGVSIPAESSKAQAAQASSSKLQQQTGSSSTRKSGASPTTSKGDSLGQQYNDPRSVVMKGIDVIIVGRGILNADDSEEEAERYRVEGWRAIQERCQVKKR